MEVILDLVVEYPPYEKWDSEHLVSHPSTNGDFIYTILIIFP